MEDVLKSPCSLLLTVLGGDFGVVSLNVFRSRCFMPCFVFFCRLFISKLQWINYLGWGRKSLFVCYRLLVIVWFLFGGVAFYFTDRT